MENIVQFLLQFGGIVIPCTFGALCIVATINFVCDVYASQNAKLKKFCRVVNEKPSTVQASVQLLPTEYQRQWRAYVASGATKPSVVFEFVKKPSLYKLWTLHLLATLVSLSYCLLAFVHSEFAHLLATQVVFVLLSALVVIGKIAIDKANEKCARKTFARFVKTLNVVVKLNAPSKQNNATVPQKVTSPQSAIDKAIDVLHQKGLDKPRTVEEQRKLNLALNNLVQACAKK